MKRPTLIILGKSDAFLDASIAETSLSLCDHGRIVWVENAGHWVHHESADSVNADCCDF